MKMAKPDTIDIAAASDLMALLNALEDGYHPVQDDDEDGDTRRFDPEDSEHLRDLYDAIDKILERAPGMPMRVIGGMCYVIMWDRNKIIDPDADTLEMHPTHIQNARDAARYRLLRRGQHWSVANGIGDTLRAEGLDSEIDARLAEDQNTEES